jgi:AcrR family transcriptional regulator
MGDVADEAGTSMGALYRYFSSKDDMFLALIGDIHNDLFNASRSRGLSFKNDPFGALLAANEGYLELYRDNRDVMRAFIEATTVNTTYRDMWWWMRQRHIERFIAMLERDFKLTEVDGVSTRVITESLASMTEQSAYVWYAQEQLMSHSVPVNIAARVVSKAWHSAFFASGAV